MRGDAIGSRKGRMLAGCLASGWGGSALATPLHHAGAGRSLRAEHTGGSRQGQGDTLAGTQTARPLPAKASERIGAIAGTAPGL